jgi:endonuclease YncB( thermonuclease family)
VLIGLSIALLVRRRPRRGAHVRVIDGDSIAIDGINARIDGIDAPELSQPQGPAAKRALQEILAGTTVTYRVLGRCRYGRPVVRVWADGHDVAAAMVARGMAVPYLEGGRRYRLAHAHARLRGRGLWGRGGFETPAAYRARRRERRAGTGSLGSILRRIAMLVGGPLGVMLRLLLRALR